MNERLHAALAALPARQLNLLCIGVVAIAAMLAWTAGLRGPLATYRQQRAALAALEASAATMPAPASASASASASAPVPVPAAASAPGAAAPAPLPLVLVGAISRSAKLAGVEVASAAQGTEGTVAGLRQQVIDVTATGGYGDLQAWLDDIERTQPAVGIVQLGLHPGDTGPRRKATLQLAIYGAPPRP